MYSEELRQAGSVIYDARPVSVRLWEDSLLGDNSIVKLSRGEEAQRPVSGLARPLNIWARVSCLRVRGPWRPESQAPVTVSPHWAATGPSQYQQNILGCHWRRDFLFWNFVCPSPGSIRPSLLSLVCHRHKTRNCEKNQLFNGTFILGPDDTERIPLLPFVANKFRP